MTYRNKIIKKLMKGIKNKTLTISRALFIELNEQNEKDFDEDILIYVVDIGGGHKLNVFVEMQYHVAYKIEGFMQETLLEATEYGNGFGYEDADIWLKNDRVKYEFYNYFINNFIEKNNLNK